jgi:ABC-type polysaccharide/polyol phosphate export permease
MRALLGQAWLLLSAFGICFAILSGIEEIARGDVAKSLAAVGLGLVVYLTIARPARE